MKICIILVIAVASYASSVCADGYEDASDAAYCVGVYQGDIEEWKTMYNAQSQLAARIRDWGQKKFQKESFVEGAIKQGNIDAVTASKMRSVGLVDSNLCSQNIRKCMKEWSEREEKQVDLELNNMQLEKCKKETESVCERVYKHCE
jgi:hypothetical protein